MKDISDISHLSKDIFDLSSISKESQQIKIIIIRKKFKKFATLIAGFSNADERKDVEKYLKKKLACGGTVKDKIIEIQGNQREKVKELLVARGYKESLIDV
jgi:translation initiation factor 1